jgi:hypothetical protein
MSKKSNEIAMRDPALAALMGVNGDDMGYEVDASFEPDQFMGEDDFGASFGDDEDWLEGESIFGAVPAAPPAAAIVRQHQHRSMHRNRRMLLLEPNKYSDLKVERYTFSVTVTISTLGTAQAISGSNSPDVNFRPQRVTANVPSPAFVLITDARVANVSFTVGGSIDAWQWNANAVGQSLDVPTLTPANKATFTGNYTGLVPSPLSGTGSYTFVLSFSGPASIVA